MMKELTAFVREVVMPAGPDRVPRIRPESAIFPLEAGPSAIHGWGIFAGGPIPARRRVIEYTGQRIDYNEVWRRRIRPQIYIFLTGRGRAIDGAIGGSGAEFINHSCEPNLYARIRRGRIWFVSRRRIDPGEELFIDYNITGSDPLYECRCGAPTCRGYMNQLPPQTL
jgi:SET domain-containing protein